MKELFPLNTFQQDAVLKRLNELSDGINAPSFEDIVDKDGHKRFIEGNIELYEDMPEGMTKTYGKWSLSGSHLLIVLAVDIANETIIENGKVVALLSGLPEWIRNKIYAIWGGTYIDTKALNAFADNWTTQTLQIHLYKSSGGNISLRTGNNVTLTANRHLRIAFDLLIDND